MPIETSGRGGGSVQDWILLCCGVLLFAAPWTMGFSDDAAAGRAAWLGGLVIAVMAIAALVRFSEWEDWVALVAGVAVILAPWALGFAEVREAMWTFAALGLIAALASVSEIWLLHAPQQAAR